MSISLKISKNQPFPFHMVTGATSGLVRTLPYKHISHFRTTTKTSSLSSQNPKSLNSKSRHGSQESSALPTPINSFKEKYTTKSLLRCICFNIHYGATCCIYVCHTNYHLVFSCKLTFSKPGPLKTYHPAFISKL